MVFVQLFIQHPIDSSLKYGTYQVDPLISPRPVKTSRYGSYLQGWPLLARIPLGAHCQGVALGAPLNPLRGEAAHGRS